MRTPNVVTLRSWLTGDEDLGGGHSLTQRTETAICFWPWGPRKSA